MKSIAVSFLKPGMVFSEPVYIDENNILVPAKTPIRKKDIENLQAWGIEYIQADGDPSMGDVGGTNIEDVLAAAQSSRYGSGSSIKTNKTNPALLLLDVHENRGAYPIYTMLIERMNIELLRIAAGENVADSESINTISMQLLQAVRDKRERFVGFILGGEVRGYEMAKSSINTAILSALIAQEVKLPTYKVNNIVIGALLHDAGMTRLPKEILDKRGGLSDAERQRMRSHPQIAHKIATKELKYQGEVGNIVLQHHERWDGEGYPDRIAGDKIEIGARIVSIADAFEAMVSHKPYRTSMVGYQAMKNILADNSRRFDPSLLKAFILTMGIYPIGSIVRLNNGVIARVSDTRASAPLRPRIQVLIDANKKVFKHEEGNYIDLLAEKSMYITKAMTVKELSELDE